MVSVLLGGGSWVRPDTVAPLAGLIRASQAGRGLRMREGSFLQQGSSRCCFVCYSTGAMRHACRCSLCEYIAFTWFEIRKEVTMKTAVFRASSVVDTDVSERPAALFFKGISRAVTNLLGPQLYCCPLIPTGLFLKKRRCLLANLHSLKFQKALTLTVSAVRISFHSVLFLCQSISSCQSFWGTLHATLMAQFCRILY